MVEEIYKNWTQKKEVFKATPNIKCNLEFLPFIIYDTTKIFYLKLKENKTFDNDLYIF